MTAAINSTTGAVLFNYGVWIARFSEFTENSAVTEQVAQAYFDEAGLYLNNTFASAVQDVDKRLMILNLIAAHIGRLYSAGGAFSGLVGRVSSASEGSVSVATDMGGVPLSAAWWSQTQYGLSAWKALAPYRMARYWPGPGVPRAPGPSFGWQYPYSGRP